MLSKKEFKIEELYPMLGRIEDRLKEFIEKHGTFSFELSKIDNPKNNKFRNLEKKINFSIFFDSLIFHVELEWIDNFFYFKEMRAKEYLSRDSSTDRKYELANKDLYFVTQKMREFLHEN